MYVYRQAVPTLPGAVLAEAVPPALTALVLERALGVGGGTSTSTANILVVPTTTTSSSDSPFFTESSQVGGASTGSEESSSSGDLTKTVLEWVFAIAALLTIASITAWRYSQIRRRKQNMHAYLADRRSRSMQPAQPPGSWRRSVPRTTGLPRMYSRSDGSAESANALPLPMSTALFYPPSLTTGRYPGLSEPLPAVIQERLEGRGRARERERRGRRAAQGAEIDAQGRRGGARDPDDDRGGDDKDELPAYDNVGSPPQYVDADGGVLVLGGIPLRNLLSMHRDPSDAPSNAGDVRHTREEEPISTNPFTQNEAGSNTPPQPPSYPANSPTPSRSPPTLPAHSTSNTVQTDLPVNYYPC